MARTIANLVLLACLCVFWFIGIHCANWWANLLFPLAVVCQAVSIRER